VANIRTRLILAKPVIGRVPRFHGIALPLAVGSIIAVPLLTHRFPPWASRVALPLLAVTSVGIYATVPDTERVILVMAAMLIAGVIGLDARIAVHRNLLAAISVVMMGAAILDSAGRGAPIVRATGCFGVFLVTPAVGWVWRWWPGGDERRPERHPPLPMLALVHCVLVAWSSRVQIRETSVTVVLLSTGGALVLATLLLLATARPVAATP
jgi:hypothetical protein